MIAGVKDMRFQAIMPDTLHWLGVQKIDNMISMVRSTFLYVLISILIRRVADQIVRYEIQCNC